MFVLVVVARDQIVQIGLRGLGRWFDLPALVVPVDALVIMGGDTPQRLKPGVELFQQGFAREFWYTGTHVHARSALEEAIRLGVPRNATVQLHGANTWAESRQIAAQVDQRNLDSLLVVTSWYHGRRTLCTIEWQLRMHGADEVQIYYQPVYGGFGPTDWWRREDSRTTILSELAKFAYYGAAYGLPLWRC